MCYRCYSIFRVASRTIALLRYRIVTSLKTGSSSIELCTVLQTFGYFVVRRISLGLSFALILLLYKKLRGLYKRAAASATLPIYQALGQPPGIQRNFPLFKVFCFLYEVSVSLIGSDSHWLSGACGFDPQAICATPFFVLLIFIGMFPDVPQQAASSGENPVQSRQGGDSDAPLSTSVSTVQPREVEILQRPGSKKCTGSSCQEDGNLPRASPTSTIVLGLLPVHALLAMGTLWFHQILLLLHKVFLMVAILFIVLFGVELFITPRCKEACGRLSCGPRLRLSLDHVCRVTTFLCLPRV